jgi:hypothetical protein
MRRCRFRPFLAVMLVAVIASAPARAYATSAPAPNPPVFITTAGQSSDMALVKQAVDALGLKSNAAPTAICCDIKSSCTVIIVFRADEGGMKAAWLTARTEQRRVEDILGKMRASGLAIIGVYLGGRDEMDPITRRLLDAGMSGVHYLIAARGASTDEYFGAAAQKHGFQLILIDSPGRLQDAIAGLFTAE